MRKTKLTRERKQPSIKTKKVVKIKVKTNPRKKQCWKCKKNTGIIKFYLMPGDEKVRCYHSACRKLLLAKKKI